MERRASQAGWARDEETAGLLVRRLRAFSCFTLAALVLYGLADLRLHPADVVPLFLLKLALLGTTAAGLWVVRDRARWRWSVPVGVVMASMVCLTSVASGIITGSGVTTPLLCIIVTMFTGTFLPWGLAPQMVIVGVAAFSTALNLIVGGLSPVVFGYTMLGAAVAFASSTYASCEAERFRLHRRHAEAGMRESEARARAILEAALDCIITADHTGRIVEFNPAAERTFGYTRDAVIGKQLADVIIPSALRAQHRRGLERYLATGEGPVLGKRVKITGMRADGSEFPVELAITAIKRDGPPLFTGYLRDITEQERAEEAMARVNRLKSEFVSTMSHELRTPLNVILGFVEMARDPRIHDHEQGKAIEGIGRAARQLLDLVETTLEVSKLEAGREEVRLEPVSLPAFWRELERDCGAIQRQADVALEWGGEMPEATITTDTRKLSIVVRNLVGNALKFTERGRVRAEAHLGRHALTVRVSDTGIGIRPEDQETIFEMFRQADSSDSRRFQGTGLGLYIVRRFVHQLDGTIALESMPGRGSCFTVTFPQLQARLPTPGAIET